MLTIFGLKLIHCPFNYFSQLRKINNDTSLLPNVHLALRWYDTKGETVLATRAITEMICDGIAMIFGPEGHCYVEAVVTQSRNIPMISYVSFFIIFPQFLAMPISMSSILFSRNVQRIKHLPYLHLPALNHQITR